MHYLWNLTILLTSPNNYKHISNCNLVLASPSDYKSNYTFKPCCKTNHNTQNKMSFWMAGSSQAARTKLSKTSVFTRQIPIYWVTNRLQSSPYGVDKYNCWGCCAVIIKAGKEARRSPVMIVFGLYCLPIKIISRTAWSVAADNSMLPHMLFFFPRSSRTFLRVVESLVFLSHSTEDIAHDLWGKRHLCNTQDLLKSHLFNSRTMIHLCVRQKFLDSSLWMWLFIWVENINFQPGFPLWKKNSLSRLPGYKCWTAHT